jgi:hypothetical protein
LNFNKYSAFLKLQCSKTQRVEADILTDHTTWEKAKFG